jgi:hypothetical protein
MAVTSRPEGTDWMSGMVWRFISTLKALGKGLPLAAPSLRKLQHYRPAEGLPGMLSTYRKSLPVQNGKRTN